MTARLFVRVSSLVLLLSLAGCTALPKSEPTPAGVEIDGIVINNQLAITITDAQVLVPATGNFVSCGNIQGRSSCSTGFPGRPYSSNALLVSWKESGTPQSTDEFVVKIGSDIDMGRSARLEVFIFSPGQAGARLIQ